MLIAINPFLSTIIIIRLHFFKKNNIIIKLIKKKLNAIK